MKFKTTAKMKLFFLTMLSIFVVSAPQANAASVCLHEMQVSDAALFQNASIENEAAAQSFLKVASFTCKEIKQATKTLNITSLVFTGISTYAAVCGPPGLIVTVGFATATAVTGYLALEVADVPCRDTDTEAFIEKRTRRIVCEVLESKNMPCDPVVLNGDAT